MTKIIIVILIIIAVVLIGLMFWLPSFFMTGRRQTLSEALSWQSERYDTSFYDELEKTDYTVEGAEGYILHAELLKSSKPSGKYVIISHGYTDNRMGSLKYAKMYLELGYNCIIYDLRGHGENENTFTTYGILEGKDLFLLSEDTLSRYPDLSILGLHGESLGAASTISSLRYKPDIDFAVADCGFSDIENVLRGGIKSAHLPGFLFDLASAGSKIRYGYALKDMRPIDALSENEVPILFIHGAEDSFILPKNSEDMLSATNGRSELYLIPGAGHAESMLNEPELYKEYAEPFLQKIEEGEE